LEGFQGIVRDEAIWATDIKYLNDASEFIHASELFKKQILKRKAGANDVESLFLEQATLLFDEVYSLSQTRVFVASFSISNDQLSQWRAYGVDVLYDGSAAAGYALAAVAVDDLVRSINSSG